MSSDLVATIEVRLKDGLKLRISASEDPEQIVKAVRTGLQAVKIVRQAIKEFETDLAEARFPSSLLERIGGLNNKELASLLLYFEGPMGKEQINQRSKELGKEIKRDWLDKKLYDEMKAMIVAQKSPEGKTVYTLSERGKLEAKQLLSMLSYEPTAA